MKKRDLLILSVAAVVLIFLWMAPPETTHRVPLDDTHDEIYKTFAAEGKKAAGKICQDCHNEDGVPFPEGHPPKYRCLFCHKLMK